VSVLQYKDLVLEVNGNEQGLVQNATISCDAGLDLINISTGSIPYIRDRAGQVSFEQLLTSVPAFKNIAGFSSPISIKLIDNVGDKSIEAEECLVTNAEYSLTAQGFFLGKYTYSTIGLKTGSDSASVSYTGTGRAPYRVFGGSGAPGRNHQSVVLAVQVNRENFYNKGDARPKHSIINFPIQTTASIEMASETGMYNTLSGTIDRLNKIGACSAAQTTAENISINVGSSALTITGFHLQSLEIGEGGVGGSPQMMVANYISYDDYGFLQAGRITDYSTADSSPGGGGPPEEPE
tara:strand:- start:4704 stop:5585 length:882 start_codon:yes stop_codon:yes gene_type:complete